MPSEQLEIYPIFNLEGGVNTRFSLHALLQNEAADMQNFHLEARGGIEKRKGYSKFITDDTPTTDPITGLWQHRIFGGTDYVFRIEDGNAWTTTGASWTDRTGAETISADPDDLVIAEVFRLNSIFTDGVNIPLKWDGSGNVEKISQAIDGGADTITKAYTLVRHRERIVLGNVTATESAVSNAYESGIWGSTGGTLDDWVSRTTEDGFLELGSGDGDSITNLQDILGYLVAFKQRSFFRIEDFGSSTIDSKRVSGSVGCPGKHAAIVVGSYVYFIDSSGHFWQYDARQGDNPDALVELSRDKLGVRTTELILRDRLPYAWLHHDPDRDEIYCFITEEAGAETNVAWVYNITTKGFVPHRHAHTFNIGCNFIDTENNPYLLVGSYDGQVYQFDNTSLTDDGTSIECYLMIRHVDSGNLSIKKGYRWLHLYTRATESQDLTITHYHDFATAGDSYVVSVSGGGDLLDSTFILDQSALAGPGEKMTRVKLYGYDRWTQIKISQTVDEDLKILGLLLYYKPAGIHLGPTG